MPGFRSSSRLFLIGCAFLTCSVAAFLIGGESVVAWGCLLLACPPIFEAGMPRRVASIAAIIYDHPEEVIEQHAYKRSGSLVRGCYLFVFLSLAYGLGRGGLNLLPDNLWTVAFCLIPMAIYLGWAGMASWSSIRAAAKREGWQRRWRAGSER